MMSGLSPPVFARPYRPPVATVGSELACATGVRRFAAAALATAVLTITFGPLGGSASGFAFALTVRIAYEPQSWYGNAPASRSLNTGIGNGVSVVGVDGTMILTPLSPPPGPI